MSADLPRDSPVIPQHPPRRPNTGKWSDPVAPFQFGLKSLHIFIIITAFTSLVFTSATGGLIWERRQSHELRTEMWETCQTHPDILSSTNICASLASLDLSPTARPEETLARPEIAVEDNVVGGWYSSVMYVEHTCLRTPLSFLIALGGDLAAQMIPLQVVILAHERVFSSFTGTSLSTLQDLQDQWGFSILSARVLGYLAYKYGDTFASYAKVRFKRSRRPSSIATATPSTSTSAPDETTPTFRQASADKDTTAAAAKAPEAAKHETGWDRFWPAVIPDVVADGLLMGVLNIKLVQWLDDYIEIEQWGVVTMVVQVWSWYLWHIFGVFDLPQGRAVLRHVLEWPLWLPNWAWSFVGSGQLLDADKVPVVLVGVALVVTSRIVGLWTIWDLFERRVGSIIVEKVFRMRWLPPNAS